MKKKALIISSLCIIVLILLLIIFLPYINKNAKTYIITETEDGFKPEQLTIKKGETVTFKTERNKFFWPASDLHPTHLIYPEFDPKDPVDPKKTWSFTFNKKGSWKFHDHLAPYYTGEITVK